MSIKISRELLSQHLQSCTNPRSITQLHSLLLKSGNLTAPDCFFPTKLAAAYGNLTSPLTAHQLFDEIPNPNTHLFNSILRSYLRSKQWRRVLLLFKKLAAAPDPFTFPIALKASASLSELRHGKAIHGLIVKSPSAGSDLFVGSALIEFYAKCGEMGDALDVFGSIREPDVVVWTSVVTGYQKNGESRKAVSFFSRMVVGDGVVPGPVTVISLVAAIGQLGDARAAKCCHGYVTRMGCGSDLSLLNSILNLYSKLGEVKSAMKLFEMMGERDVITWSCMIACCVHNGKPMEAFEIYRRMREVRIEPNKVTIISVIQACALAHDIEQGRKVHELVILKGFEMNTAVSTSLINMYMKCNCYSDAMNLFLRVPEKDVVTWASVIGGCAQNGFSNESLRLFTTMLSHGVKPDAVIMVKVLAACSQLGVLRQAHCFHNYLFRRGFDNKTFVCAALIDMYSKCGSLNAAVKVFESVNEKDVVIWSSMIAGYGSHGLGTKAIETFEHLIDSSIQPNNVTFVSILSACSHSGLVAEGKRLFSSMRKAYGVNPDSEHYSILIDLLSRNGELNEAVKLIEGMSSSVGPHIFCALLAGCRIHKNIEIGELVGKILIGMEPGHAGYYNLMSDMYAFDERWNDVEEIKGLMKERNLRKNPGYSSIEVSNEVHTFSAGERLHLELEGICDLLKNLKVTMKVEGYVPDVRD